MGSRIVRSQESLDAVDDRARGGARRHVTGRADSCRRQRAGEEGILLEFELDNCTPAEQQSWLGALSQLSAGGGYCVLR